LPAPPAEMAGRTVRRRLLGRWDSDLRDSAVIALRHRIPVDVPPRSEASLAMPFSGGAGFARGSV